MNVKCRGALAGIVGLVVLPVLVASCGSDDSGTTYTPGPGLGGSAGEGGASGMGGSAGQPSQGGAAGQAGSSGGICLLNNCKADEECKGCGDSRNTCNKDTKVCIACDDAKGLKCPDGQKCTQYGTCVPSNKTCPTDAKGEPSISCTMDADCEACDPAHRVCDTTKSKCVGCSQSNLKNCAQSDYCKDNKCTPKCPASCTVDNDCGQCGTGVNQAHACFNHKCAKCSGTFACPAGQQCMNGQCVPPCGLPGPVSGTCDTNEDCLYCGIASTGGADGGTGGWDCKFPLNGANHGKCTPKAAGCSDLGNGVIVLPEPYSNYTQTCSQDPDCVGAGIQYNVGKQIRDWLGSDELNIGIGTLKIQDANVNYGMNVCADIEIASKSCGLCVPCKVDTDCKPIPVDTFILDLFKGQALAQLGGAFLVDLLWGDDENEALNFFCQPVAAGYGACIPCANPMHACAKGSGPNTGNCDHDVCKAGTALKSSCGACAAAVCQNDAYCCDGTDGAWDSVCVSEVDKYCTTSCGGGTTKCDHDPCTAGKALDSNCSACVTAVCADDAFCCNTTSGEWDSYCVTSAKDVTKFPACKDACTGGCTHSECVTGPALKKECSACATSVCTADPFCCSTDWDSTCADEAADDTNCNCP